MKKSEQLRSYLEKLRDSKQKQATLDVEFVLAALNEKSSTVNNPQPPKTFNLDGGEF